MNAQVFTNAHRDQDWWAYQQELKMGEDEEIEIIERLAAVVRTDPKLLDDLQNLLSECNHEDFASNLQESLA